MTPTPEAPAACTRRCALARTLAALVLAPALSRPARAQQPEDAALAAAISGTQRGAANAARDPWRHPYETLRFFGLRPEMTVVELSPGGGWYTEILAPYLRDKGRLILAADDPESIHAYYRRSADRLKAKLDAQPAVYGKVEVVAFEPPARVALAAPASVDMVLTFRNLHNWAAEGDEVVGVVMRSVFTSLKRGGVFGVIDHRLPADRPQDAKASSGYVHQAYALRMAEAAGFKLAASSEINANARDSADHAGGVWALPPSYRNKDAERARYQAIGESDRFTLRFVKP